MKQTTSKSPCNSLVNKTTTKGHRDNRKNKRTVKEINVWLYNNEMLVALARTKNIAEKGFFIKTNVLLFPKNSKLEVVFDIGNKKERCRLPATVVHRSLEGIGVMVKKHIVGV